jgi:16S rRNA (guanine527-N7)-methyltransferase
VARRDQAGSFDPALGSVDPALHPPLAFPEDDWRWLLARAEALGIADPQPRRERLEALFGHLVGVNRWLNLTTLLAPRDYLKGHVLDALSALLDRRLKHLSEGAPCVDLGSGGGYPGLPLALWTPRIRWVLADARRKKAEFLAAAARVSGASVTARHLSGGRAQADAPDLHRRCQLVVCRAMGACAEVLAEAAPLLAKAGHVVVYKGQSYAGEERAAAHAAAPALGLEAVGERSVRLEDGDPERVLAVFVRTD